MIDHRREVAQRYAALVAGVELVAVVEDTHQQRLRTALAASGGRGLVRLVAREHCPVVRCHAGGLANLPARHLHEVSEVSEAVAAAHNRAGAGHVHRDEPVGTPSSYRIQRSACAADLLRHRVDGEVKFAGTTAQAGGVGFDRVEIQHVAVGRNAACLVQLGGSLHEAWVAFQERAQEHLRPPSALAC